MLTGERRKRDARAELAADIAVADGAEVGPGDRRPLDDRAACRLDVRLHREVDVVVEDLDLCIIGIRMSDRLVDVVGGAGGVDLEGVEDELVNRVITLANGLPMVFEVSRAFGVVEIVGFEVRRIAALLIGSE